MTQELGSVPHDQPIETKIAQKFAEFNLLNTDEDSNLIYFDEIGVRAIIINTAPDNSSIDPEKILRSVEKRIGPPRTIPFTKQKKLRLLREEAKRQVLLEQENKQKEAFREKLERTDRERRCSQWAARLAEETERNKPPPEKSVLPLRRYLMTYVMPVLTDGMMKCVAERPKDPVDFLAEYLVANSQPLYLQEGLVPFKQMTSKAARKKEKALRDRKVAVNPTVFPEITQFEDESQLLSL